VTSEAFKDLLKAWSRQLNWQFAAQYEFPSPQKSRIRPDGTIFHSLGLPIGMLTGETGMLARLRADGYAVTPIA
jgi:hypothetical protein